MADTYPERIDGDLGEVLGQVWPDRELFRSLAREQRCIPVTLRVLADELTPLSLYRKLTSATGQQNTFLLESAGQGPQSRYSIIGVRARASLTERHGRAAWCGDAPAGLAESDDPLEALRLTAQAFTSRKFPHLPPFTGGLVGFLSYDAVRSWEKLGPAPVDEIGTPLLCMLLAQDVAIFDHHDSTVVLVANALNMNGLSSGVDEAYESAVRRIDTMREALRTPVDINAYTYQVSTSASAQARTSQEQFENSVREAIQDIRDGEIFQVVPSQRFSLECEADPLDVYRVLRRLNPSPYMFLLRAHDGENTPMTVVGASPETLVHVSGRQATIHPIAGSRPRGSSPEEDDAIIAGLLADPKERSEHLMLVDLGRNDLHKVCEPDSVEVSEYARVVKYSHVSHIVSTVRGTLRPEVSAFDALQATFPAGTLTGAPKPRAMQIIDRLEPVARGVYAGVVGYLDFAGDMDMAIAIRTAVIKDGKAHVQAGGGVVADSHPTMEHRESLAKAAAALRAVASAHTVEPQ